MNTIAVLLTVHNRKDTTLQGLRTLYRSIELIPEDGFSFDVFLVDDGSTDGTADAVRKEFPLVKIIQGNGNLFWVGGMNRAWKEALAVMDYDFYLWMNDDARLYPCAISEMLSVEKRSDNHAMVCGVFEDGSHQISYGARDEKGSMLHPGSSTPAYYMNGNLVLIPHEVVNAIGLIDEAFSHSGGDYDYGLRARAKGIDILITNNVVGMTNRHQSDKTPYLSRKLPLYTRFALLYSKKYSIQSAFCFNKRYKGLGYALRKFVKVNFLTLFPILHRTKCDDDNSDTL